MDTNSPTINKSPRRGRPPKADRGHEDTRAALIRSGVEVLTENSFVSAGIDGILKKVGVPKGSFYYYFKNKEEFGLAVIQEYARYFNGKLTTHLENDTIAPLDRLKSFVASAEGSMKKHNYKRGCLVGNLGQEVGLLPTSFRSCLQDIFLEWQQYVSQCLRLAQQAGDIASTADCDELAEFFWLGWEGAVMRAKLMESGQPLRHYLNGFIAGLPQNVPPETPAKEPTTTPTN